VCGKKTTTILLILLYTATVSSFLGIQIHKASAEEPRAVLTGVIYDQGIDTDGDGSSNHLETGVKAGDWAKYNITGTWQSTDPSATEPSQIDEFRKIEWVKFEVQSVSNTYITILQTYHYKNGTDQSPPSTSGDIATQFIMFVIPSNLSEGDVIPGTVASINSTISRSYAGANRAVNYVSSSSSFLGINITQIMYWDKATGFLCEMFMENSVLTNNYVTTISTLLEMTETNMWKIPTDLSCSVSKNTIAEGDNIVISGSINVTLSGKTVTLTYMKPDGSTMNRAVTTGSDGSYSDSYTPDATGSWNVAASWEGDSTHSGAASSSKSFAVTPKSFIETPLGIATVGGGIIVVIAIIVLVLRKRKPKGGKNEAKQNLSNNINSFPG
jgi:hypothetical protein